jgi:hypothetical protein
MQFSPEQEEFPIFDGGDDSSPSQVKKIFFFS